MSVIADSLEETIVVLEACHCTIPPFNLSHNYREYHDTLPSEIGERIRDATIVITTIRQVTPEHAAQAPRLKLLVVMGTGCAWVDAEYYAGRGITVCNCPQSNIESVSGHAMGMYFAVRRQLFQMHYLATKTDEWPKNSTLTKKWEGGPPLSCGQEVVGIVGYGALGKAIEKLCHGIGMCKVMIAERKVTAAEKLRSGRDSFESVLRHATVIVICCPKDDSTVNMIDAPELREMRQDAILVNVARGGIINEQALATALTDRSIAGAATDVLEQEPGERGKSPLLPIEGEIPNLIISPHVSWYAQQTLQNLQTLMKAVVEGFYHGKPVNVVVTPR